MFIFVIFHRYFPFEASVHSWTVSPFRKKASSPFNDIPADPPLGRGARKHLWHADSWARRRQDMQALDLWIRHAAMAHKSLCTQCNSLSQCHGWSHFSQVQIMQSQKGFLTFMCQDLMMQSQEPSCLPREAKPKSAVVLSLWAHWALKVLQHPTAVLTD